MSKATEILTDKWTAYPNDLIRNRNDFMTKNERHLMIFLWDRLYGYETPNNYLSYSVILRNCKDFPKNNAKLSQAIKSLERKGLLKVFRENRFMNKYFIGEQQVRYLKWYGEHFKQWKEGVIESATESIEIETENHNEENQQEIITSTETKKPIGEPTYLRELKESVFLELYPDMDLICLEMYGNKTLGQFKIIAHNIRQQRYETEKKEKETKKNESKKDGIFTEVKIDNTEQETEANRLADEELKNIFTSFAELLN